VEKSQNITISLIVVTCNRIVAITDLLDQLELQFYKNFEVIIVDDCSNGVKLNMLISKVSFKVKILSSGISGYGLGYARNLGAYNAVGDTLVFLDDDCIPMNSYFLSIAENILENSILCGARVDLDKYSLSASKKLSEINTLERYKVYELGPILKEGKGFVVENNMAINRNLFFKIGMFSQRFRLYGYIGQEFLHRLVYFDVRYMYNQEMDVFHDKKLEMFSGISSARKFIHLLLSSRLRMYLCRRESFNRQSKFAKSYTGKVEFSFLIEIKDVILALSYWFAKRFF
jgi:glycosyltransferase involved in cell wall biosynthesis